MPIYEFECRTCGIVSSGIYTVGEGSTCSRCGVPMARLVSRASIIIPGNMGPKLRNRVALDDELKKQGMSSPLFSSEERKDQCRWALKKEGGSLV